MIRIGENKHINPAQIVSIEVLEGPVKAAHPGKHPDTPWYGFVVRLSNGREEQMLYDSKEIAAVQLNELLHRVTEAGF